MNLVLYVVLLFGISTWKCYAEHNNVTDIDEEHTKLLSRRKRYLIFPDGSSFQLVFCTQNHGYLQIGNIVWFGNTAALAWELPTDPAVFNIFKDRIKIYGNRRSDIENSVVYVDENGRVIKRQPYKKRLIVNPAFAKRSVATPIKKLHTLSKEINYLNDLNENSIEFHRSGRKSLYEKVEKVLQALGWNGRECVLRLLCESRKIENKQGTFIEEIIRATFTLPKGREFKTNYHKQYDEAHGTDGDCQQLYPYCEDLHGENLFKQY